MNKTIKAISVLLIAAMMLFTISTTVFAVDPNAIIGNMEQGNNVDTGIISTICGQLANIQSTIGIIVAVIVLLVLGIKYMMGSASEKAEYKKTMFSYIIGLVLLISVCSFVQIIYNLTTDITSEIVEPSHMTGGGCQSSGHGAGRRTTTAPGD